MDCDRSRPGGPSFTDQSRISLQQGFGDMNNSIHENVEHLSPDSDWRHGTSSMWSERPPLNRPQKFLQAAQDQNIGLMRELLRSKVNVDCVAPETISNIDSANYVAKGSSALHLTVNIDIARLLLAAKANVNQADYEGRTALHCAARKDEAALVAILIEEGGDLAKEGIDGDNPLHTAVKANLQNCGGADGAIDAIKVMVGQGVDLEAKDQEDNDPIAIAKAQRKDYIAQYLQQRLHGVRNPGRPFCVWLMDAGYAFSFWGMFVVFNVVFYLLLMPEPPAIGLFQVIYYFMALLTATSHLMSWNTDPGYLKHNEKYVNQYHACQAQREKSQDDSEAYAIFKDGRTGKDVVRLCPTCKVSKPRRSKHCTICRLCVDRFDHHCPWINNCVGRANHRVFIVFISSLMVLLLSMAACCAAATIHGPRGALPFIRLPFFPDSWHESSTKSSEPFLVQYMCSDQEGSCPAHRWVVCTLGVMLLVMGVRVGCLWWEQVVRVHKNITTYEENSPWRFPYLSHRPGRDEDHPVLANDFDRGSCGGNCRDFWNLGACDGPSMGKELTVPYYMYDIYKELAFPDVPDAADYRQDEGSPNTRPLQVRGDNGLREAQDMERGLLQEEQILNPVTSG